MFQIQDEIALQIGSRIGDRYGPLGRYLARSARSGRSKNWETYYWIMQFYHYHENQDQALHLEVMEGSTNALRRDSGSSEGWAALAITCLDEYRMHVNPRPSASWLDTALEHAARAVDCDQDNAFAYQALAMAHFYRREFDEFRFNAGRALELNPGHTDVLANIGFCYSQLGEWDVGLPILDKAIELSPVHPLWYHYPRAYHFAAEDEFLQAIREIGSV